MNKATRTMKRFAHAPEDKLLNGLRVADRQLHKAIDRLSSRRLARLQAEIGYLQAARQTREMERMWDGADSPVNYRLTDIGVETLDEQIQEACKPFTVDSQGTVTR